MLASNQTALGGWRRNWFTVSCKNITSLGIKNFYHHCFSTQYFLTKSKRNLSDICVDQTEKEQKKKHRYRLKINKLSFRPPYLTCHRLNSSYLHLGDWIAGEEWKVEVRADRSSRRWHPARGLTCSCKMSKRSERGQAIRASEGHSSWQTWRAGRLRR